MGGCQSADMFLFIARVFKCGYQDVSRVCQSVDMWLLGCF